MTITFLDKRVNEFIRDHPDKDIQSFTLADQQAYEKLVQAGSKACSTPTLNQSKTIITNN